MAVRIKRLTADNGFSILFEEVCIVGNLGLSTMDSQGEMGKFLFSFFV